MHQTYTHIIKELVDEYKYLVQAINNQDLSAIKRSLAILRVKILII
jgi:hypothetical protein